jgi:hypothetical protein
MSEIKVNKISQRSGTAITLGNSGTDFQLPSGADIVAQSGSTITIAAGATITNSGTATGFGATYNGAVNWDTTPKTTTVTAASGVGYFINTTSGAVTVNLPVGVVGATIALVDYANTWDTNNVTVNANGSEKIGGIAAPAALNTEGQSVTFTYVDSTQGWKNTQDSTSNVTGNPYVVATGGTISTCGNYKIHTFTGPGTFTVTNTGPGSSTVDYLVVAGGGSSGSPYGAGGGAGGYRESKATGAPWTASPLASSTSLPVTATAYPITVGAGGAGVPASPGAGLSGNNSVFSTITSAGGGGGGRYVPGPQPGRDGFSGGSGGGGGGGAAIGPGGVGGSGNTPPVSPSQGNPGGAGATGPQYGAAGGGGATSAGTQGSSSVSGFGGNGAGTGINPSPTVGTSGPSPTLRYFGGGGGCYGSPPTSGGYGGGGGGPGIAGTTNTGGGGGAEGVGGSGGSGIVIIRYLFQ